MSSSEKSPDQSRVKVTTRGERVHRSPVKPRTTLDTLRSQNDAVERQRVPGRRVSWEAQLSKALDDSRRPDEN